MSLSLHWGSRVIVVVDSIYYCKPVIEEAMPVSSYGSDPLIMSRLGGMIAFPQKRERKGGEGHHAG